MAVYGTFCHFYDTLWHFLALLACYTGTSLACVNFLSFSMSATLLWPWGAVPLFFGGPDGIWKDLTLSEISTLLSSR